ncbi:MAG: acyl-CoA dehydrogenase family protein [Chloroflexi bacterium]|nr:acyl-CoA dehydrogenase family protein [Chloroflexota bacterium]
MTETTTSPTLARLAPALELLRANTAEADRTGIFPPENMEALRKAGAFEWSLAKRLGGQELGAVERMGAIEALGAADLATIWIFANYDSQTWDLSCRLLADGFPEAETVLREGQACSGTAAPLPGSFLEGEEIVVNGRFQFTTGWKMARWLRGMVLVPGPSPELPAPAEPPKFHARVVMIPMGRPEVQPEETWDATGLRATQTDTIEVKSLRLPRSYSAPFITDMQRQDPAYPVPSPYYREPGWTHANARVGLSLLGCAGEAFRLAREYTSGTAAKFSGQPAARFPGVRYAMTEAWVEITTALAAFHGIAAASDARVATSATWAPADEMAAWATGMHGARAALRAVDHISMALGATGTQKALPFERHFRDIRSGALHLGVHPSLVGDRIAAHLFPAFAR